MKPNTMKRPAQIKPAAPRYILGALALIFILISNGSMAQTICNPPIPVNAGADVTIPCGGTANLGEVPSPPTNNPMAASCTTPAQLTQGGGVYTQSVSTTGGINGNNINNLNTLIGGIDPMGPNAWQSVWYSNYTSQIVESTAGGTFNLNISGRSLYNNPPYSYRIWIDWNNDGTFDNTPGGELVYTTALTNVNPMSFNNISIAVPAGQQPGVFRMRIRAKDNSPFVASDNACTYNNAHGTIAPYAGYTGNQTGAYWFSSEIEDYGVKISGSGAAPGGNYTYSWTPPTNLNDPNIPNPTATPPSTTTYTITVTDHTRNCISTDQVTVTIVTTTPAFTNPGPICSGTAFTLPTTSNNGIAGTWSLAINNTATTTYTFTPNQGQCAITTQITVVVNPEVIPVFTNPGPICSGTAFTLPNTSNNGIIGTWNPVINNTTTTTYTFTPNTAQCAITTTMTVVIDNQVVPAFTNPGSICPGTTFTLPMTSNNGVTGIWSPAVNNTATTTYTFTPDNAGCAVSTTMIVVVSNQVIPAFTNPGPICPGTAFTLPTTSNNGITGTWLPAVNNTVTTAYTFTPDNVGCAAPATMTVVVNNQVVPAFTNPGPVCPGTTFSLPATSNNGVAGVWSPTANNTATTTYTFTPDNMACAGSMNMTVVVNPHFEIGLSGGTDACEGETILPIIITATGGVAPYTFTYAVDQETAVTITSNQNTAIIDLNNYPGFNNHTPGCYDLIIGGSAAGACLAGNTVFTDYVCIYPQPDASFSVTSGDAGICVMTNTSIGATSYTWNFGDHSNTVHLENPTHQFSTENPGNYTIELIAYNDKGCSDTAYRVISIEEELIFYVPNAFTPDGDRYNNIFNPVMTSGYDPFNYQFEIYNRWGECIFLSKNVAIGWDGTYNGELAQDGIYVWKIAFKTARSDEKKTYVGHVNIIR